MVSRLVSALAGLSILVIVHAAPADLVGLDANGDLHTVSTTDGSITLIGNTGIGATGSLEYSPADGFLYSMSIGRDATLYRIDPTDATTTVIGAAGFVIFEGGLQFAPDGTLYGTNGNNAGIPELFTVDVATGEATVAGVISGGQHDINGLGWRSDGSLVGLDRVTNSLLLIDPGTQIATSLAAVPETVGNIGGMAGSGGSGFYNVTSGNLYSVDYFSGVSTFIGNMGTEMRGLAMIPAPGAVLLLALGLLATRRRRG